MMFLFLVVVVLVEDVEHGVEDAAKESAAPGTLGRGHAEETLPNLVQVLHEQGVSKITNAQG